MRHQTSTHQNRASRRFDFTLAGDVDLDIMLYGLPEDLPLERELLAGGMALCLGGSSAITAHNLSALGNSVGLITTAAEDSFSDQCQMELRHAGVDLSSCVPVEHVQTGVTVHLQHQELRHMLTYAGATFNLAYNNLDLDYLADANHFHMASYYLQRELTRDIPRLFATLKQAGLTISLDPNDDPDSTWARGILEALCFVDVLMPNERETCLIAAEPDLDQAISVLRQLVPLLVIKRGARGASAFSATQSWHVPAYPANVVDGIGAGDSFNAGFLHGWTRGWPIEKALGHGSLTGAWSTTCSGGTSAFRDQRSLQDLATKWAETARAEDSMGSATPPTGALPQQV